FVEYSSSDKEPDEEVKRKEEERKRRKQERKWREQLKQQEEEHKRREAEIKRQHEEERRQYEEEHKRREAEIKRQHEEEVKRKEEERKRREAEIKRQHEEEVKRKEEERKRQEAELKRQHEEELKRKEEERKKFEEEAEKYKSADHQKWTILKNDEFIKSLLRKIRNKYPGTEMEKLRAEARDRFGIDSSKYNLGITGQSGVGKSTLINAICGYDDNDSRAAEVGVTECTDRVRGYPHPKMRHLVLYDLPGAGTRSHPIGTYFFDKRLYVFDCLLVVMAVRAFEDDLILAKLAQEKGTPVVFILNYDIAQKDIGKEVEFELSWSKDIQNTSTS
ncbi:hypothetical protein FO519_004426, partial [Halicephalobus sp. NKZ332]